MNAILSRAAFLLLAVQVAIVAHELDISVQLVAPAVILRATYAGSEPVPFAKVQVFAPSQRASEFQTGVTDKRGYFGFVPDGPGQWRVVVDDELGHKRDLDVAVPQPFEAKATAPGQSSRLERVMLGLALIAGVTGLWYGFKVRSESRRNAS